MDTLTRLGGWGTHQDSFPWCRWLSCKASLVSMVLEDDLLVEMTVEMHDTVQPGCLHPTTEHRC